MMKNKKLTVFISLLMTICISSTCFKSLALARDVDSKKEQQEIDVESAKKELIDTAITYIECVYVELYNINDTVSCIGDLDTKINNLYNAINSNNYTEEAVDIMQNEVDKLIDLKAAYETDLAKYTKWETEHYYAAKVWEFLKQDGYSDAAACGIIGNMMVETSGGSLNLKPTVYSATGKYYGLCQWSRAYCLHGSSFEQQLDYLKNSIGPTFAAHGYRYSSGFTFDNYICMDSSADAALAFAKVYERCGSESYYARQRAAQNVYNYFVN